MKADIIHELDQVMNGHPWYGSSVTDILSQVDPSYAFEKIGEAHSMAELLLHMIAWTEEVTARLRGKIGTDPDRGDWPAAQGNSWPELIAELQTAHKGLLSVINEVPEERMNDVVPYEEELPAPVSFRQTLAGLAQHHAYHLGQIAILNRQFKSDRTGMYSGSHIQ
ncbi:DinB family protein [Arcticibacter sp. MXS-1]|uniref:DinB family protein n=1 Tax=Arcticibacter sp. MXS-1 TaxID=3341726 RepID=UPI0035A8EFA8